MNPIITIFTPTYNRAYTLHLGYESLKKQDCKDFIWLIIDDGSSDNTKDLVDTWIHEGEVSIRYYYQENKGMHGAHNTAYELIETELNICIDSDDYMADNAIGKIIQFWRAYGSSKYAGIVGLDASPVGKVIGTEMPRHIKSSTSADLYEVHKVKGDKKMVYRTVLTRKVLSYPVFEGEKYCPLSYKYILIDQEAPLLIMNKVLCHVEYLEDGSSLNMFKQYRKNPKGFAFFRKVAMQYASSPSYRFRQSVHYVSSSIMVKNYKYLFETPCKFNTFLATPFGFALYMYIQKTNKSTVVKTH
ncbi:glycosyltransferase [Salipaludibacillus neizhouensis]|uniref:Glycosyltransferase n=1 Tax=Salipaludibacillus neizhouensis TaxID=885475 RepID=A0A3A9KFP2_9BACI|nr:glycosyltransferase family 2 protein [Salipaludibacillus neizhouensis]RKL66435.1 glycosyltransferase [Salipaludibacillus neizhouensis]